MVRTTLAVLYQEPNMLFKFPQREIVLDCFISDELILQTAPVANAIKHVPDWWKKLPTSYLDGKNFFPQSTMKNCIGMLEYYTNSIALPLWTDLAVKINADKSYQWQFSDGRSKAVVHDSKQYEGFLKGMGHLKIESPWVFKTKQAIKWVWSQPTYSFTDDLSNIKILPGVLNFANQSDTNINMFMPLDIERTYLLPQGQILVHLTPMVDARVKVVRHLISDQELKKVIDFQRPITFINKYKNVIKQKQKFLNCPYHKE